MKQDLLKQDFTISQFLINKNAFLNWSFDYLGHSGNSLFYGEMSIDNSGLFKTVNGCLLALGRSLDLNVLYTFKGDSKVIQLKGGSLLPEPNESSIYAGLATQISKYLKLASYIDLSRNHTYSYVRDGPASEKSVLHELKFEKRNGPMAYLRHKLAHSYINETGTQTINRLELNTHSSWRLHLEYPVGRIIRCYHRIETGQHHKQFGVNSKGTLNYHEIQFQNQKKWKLNLRVTRFNIDDFNTRIYAYQHDLSHSFTVRSFQNRGTEIYALFQYHVNKMLNIKLRFAALQYENSNESGSGLDTIDGPNTHDFRAEIQIRL